MLLESRPQTLSDHASPPSPEKKEYIEGAGLSDYWAKQRRDVFITTLHDFTKRISTRISAIYRYIYIDSVMPMIAFAVIRIIRMLVFGTSIITCSFLLVARS